MELQAKHKSLLKTTKLIDIQLMDADDDDDTRTLNTKLQSVREEMEKIEADIACQNAILHDKRFESLLPELLHDSASPLSNCLSGLSKDNVSIKDFHLKERINAKVRIMTDSDGQFCVIKKLHGSKSIRKEAELLHRVRHSLIAPIINVIADTEEPDTTCCIQMPHYERGNLRQWTEHMKQDVERNGRFVETNAWVQVQNTFRQISQAVAHIHAMGVVHRDLKPENILLSSSGRIALCNFGISCDLSQAHSITATVNAMTLSYGAPEVYTNEWKSCPYALDMWSLGRMMVELLQPLFPLVFPKFNNSHALMMIDFEEFDWRALIGHFKESPHMQAYVRVCLQLMRTEPYDRMTAQELLQEPIFYQDVSKFDTAPSIISLVRNLAASRQSRESPIIITIPKRQADSDEETYNASFLRKILNTFSSPINVHMPIPFFEANNAGGRHVVGEVFDIFFAHLVRPVHALFTQLTVSDSNGTISADKAYLPTIGGNKQQFQAVGRVMAKCLVDGIRMPINLNSACLDYIIGRTMQPTNPDMCLALLQETDVTDATLYRHILSERQDTIKYTCSIGALDGSDSEQKVTDENKASIVCRSIWSRLVRNRTASLDNLRNGLSSLQIFDELKPMSGMELQQLFYGTEFLNVDLIRNCFSFMEDAWSGMAAMNRLNGLLAEALSHMSDLALRRLILRCFGQLERNLLPTHVIHVIPSSDDAIHFLSDSRIMQLSVVASFDVLRLRMACALFLDEEMARSGVERRAQLSQVETDEVAKAMGGEIKAGRWYTCPNGHPYAIGDCGGVMEMSVCPECGKDVGGSKHKSAAGNLHSNIDGSKAPAWPQ
jgi:serine/threonine protein kinase